MPLRHDASVTWDVGGDAVGVDRALQQLRARWWELLSEARASAMPDEEYRRRLREDLIVTDAGGALWRIDARSTAAEVHFTRQAPGRIAEPADPAAFLSLLDPPDPAQVTAMLEALAGPDGAQHVVGGVSTRGAQRAAAALQAAAGRGVGLRVAAGPRERGLRNCEVLIEVVGSDGSPSATFVAELVQERGAWRFARWPQV